MNIILRFFCLIGILGLLNSIPSLATTIERSTGLPDDTVNRMLRVLNRPLPAPVNCWGVALWAHGLIGELRYASTTEFLNVLKKNKCRKLRSDESPRMGDLGSFYRSDMGISHTFIHLKGSIVFEKATAEEKDRPLVVDLHQRLGQSRSSLSLNSGCKAVEGKECLWGVVNYRCSRTNDVEVPSFELRKLLDQMFVELNSCYKDESVCNKPLSETFLEITSWLNVSIAYPENLNSDFFRVAGQLFKVMTEDKSILDRLSADATASYLGFAESLRSLESSTYKEISDFPDYSNQPQSPWLKR